MNLETSGRIEIDSQRQENPSNNEGFPAVPVEPSHELPVLPDTGDTMESNHSPQQIESGTSSPENVVPTVPLSARNPHKTIYWNGILVEALR